MKIAIFSLLIALSSYGQGIISLKRNKEILKTYENLTNIKTDSEIQRIYLSSFLSLPKNGHVSELTGFTLVSLINLSHAFCTKMIERDRSLSSSERWIHDSLDLEKEVTTWNETEISHLMDNYGVYFWGEMPAKVYKAELREIFKEMSKVEQPIAQNLALSSVCMTMLSSPIVFTK